MNSQDVDICCIFWLVSLDDDVNILRTNLGETVMLEDDSGNSPIIECNCWPSESIKLTWYKAGIFCATSGCFGAWIHKVSFLLHIKYIQIILASTSILQTFFPSSKSWQQQHFALTPPNKNNSAMQLIISSVDLIAVFAIISIKYPQASTGGIIMNILLRKSHWIELTFITQINQF